MKIKDKEVALKNGKTLTVKENFPENAKATLDYLNRVAVESKNLFIDEEGFSFTVSEESEFLRSLSENPNFLMLVGFTDDEMASLATLERVSTRKRARHRAKISISVRKKFWNMGIATEMIKALFEFGKSIEIETVELEVISSNTNAIKLYEKLGFEKVGKYKNFSKFPDRYESADIMQAFI